MSIPERTSRAPSLVDSDARAGALATDRAVLTRESQSYVGSGSGERDRAADEPCDGCGCPAHEVGTLTSYRVTYVDGQAFAVRYCADCASIARLGVEHPGEAWGAASLPDQFIAIESIASIAQALVGPGGVR